ncbi:hypothetical protein Tco_0103538 [Tanacetum coccineum]
MRANARDRWWYEYGIGISGVCDRFRHGRVTRCRCVSGSVGREMVLGSCGRVDIDHSLEAVWVTGELVLVSVRWCYDWGYAIVGSFDLDILGLWEWRDVVSMVHTLCYGRIGSERTVGSAGDVGCADEQVRGGRRTHNDMEVASGRRIQERYDAIAGWSGRGTTGCGGLR